MPAAVMAWAAGITWRRPSVPSLVMLACLLLPWTPFLRVGLADRPLAAAFLDTPAFLYTAAALAVVAVLISWQDLAAGALAGYVAVSSVLTGTPLALASAHWIILGLGGVVLLSRARDSARRLLLTALLASGVLQVGYAAVQIYAARDPLFFGLAEISMQTTGGVLQLAPIGTIGNPKYFGAMLAMVAPLAPLWLLPVFLFGLYVSESRLAAVALAVGLAFRFARWLKPTRAMRATLPTMLFSLMLGIVCAAALIALTQYRQELSEPSLRTAGLRLNAWQLAAEDLAGHCSVLTGCGLGEWYSRVPAEQVRRGMTEEVYFQPHSDPVGWLYATGLAGAALAGWWLWMRRAMFTGPLAPSLAALVVLCAGLHVFHVPTLAPTALLLVGLGCSDG